LECARAVEKQRIDVVQLEVNEPDFDLPVLVKVAVGMVPEKGHTHYTHGCSYLELRMANLQRTKKVHDQAAESCETAS